MYDGQTALKTMGQHHRLFDGEQEQAAQEIAGSFMLPADLLAPSFLPVYRDIRKHRHTEYLLRGGRGSTKSTFASLATLLILINNPDMHALAMRQVANTLRDSVFAQLTWAINELNLESQFKSTISPMEITYLPTGQKIFFRGADQPEKIKSIKTPFGYIGILWFEELDQYHGPEAVRNIEQSVIRGGDIAYIFKTYNPPRSAANWVNQYVMIPKENQYQHESDYRTVPREWLGKVFIDEAEHLQKVNEKAYRHEYLGEIIGLGGQLFENVELREIKDDEIAQFDRIMHGVDWGYFPDPWQYVRTHYDAAQMTLYIYDELRMYKAGNEETAQALKDRGVTRRDLLVCDSSEPKSIADYAAFGLSVIGAEKGPDSVAYSMKWHQRLAKIVIDPARAPFSAKEFTEYEHEQDKDGNFISAYPDKNNHCIDAVRYGDNNYWRRRGQ